MKYNCEEHSLAYKFEYNLTEKEDILENLNRNNLSIDDIRKIALWKYNRVINIEDEILEKLSKILNDKNLSIENEDVREIVEDIIQCKGVGMPLASTILKFLRPDIFPIIDVRAYRALFDKKIYTYTYDKYIEYCKEIYKIRDIKGMKLSEVDEQLYMFDKENNGEI